MLDRVEVTGNQAISGRPNATGGGIADFGTHDVTFKRSTVSGNVPNDCEPANLCPTNAGTQTTSHDSDDDPMDR